MCQCAPTHVAWGRYAHVNVNRPPYKHTREKLYAKKMISSQISVETTILTQAGIPAPVPLQIMSLEGPIPP